MQRDRKGGENSIRCIKEAQQQLREREGGTVMRRVEEVRNQKKEKRRRGDTFEMRRVQSEWEKRGERVSKRKRRADTAKGKGRDGEEKKRTRPLNGFDF